MEMFSRLPVLRLKRKQAEDGVQALQVRVNAKRRRTLKGAEQFLTGSPLVPSQPSFVDVVFRRVQQDDEAEELLARSDTRLIDVPAHVVQKGRQHPPRQILCNGAPMQRVELHSSPPQGKLSEPAIAPLSIEQEDSEMYDIFTLETDGTTYDQAPKSSLLCIDADDISLFDDQLDDESLPYTSDEDARTVDYPSTPELSSDDSISRASSFDNTTVHTLHSSQCDVDCVCGMGLKNVTSYAYDPYYDDSGDDHR